MIISNFYILRFFRYAPEKRQTLLIKCMHYLRRFPIFYNDVGFLQPATALILRFHDLRRAPIFLDEVSRHAYLRVLIFPDIFLNNDHLHAITFLGTILNSVYFRVAGFLGVIWNRFCLRALVDLYSSCHLNYPEQFPKIDEINLHKADYRNDAISISYQGFPHWQLPTRHDVIVLFFRQYQMFRSRLEYVLLPIPSILSHCKKWLISLCRLSPRTDRSVFVLDFAYQHLLVRCWSFPWALKRRRDLCFTNYIMGAI